MVKQALRLPEVQLSTIQYSDATIREFITLLAIMVTKMVSAPQEPNGQSSIADLMEPLLVQPITSLYMESTSTGHQDIPSSSSHPITDNKNDSLMDTDTSTNVDEGSNTDVLPYDPDKVGYKHASVQENHE